MAEMSPPHCVEGTAEVEIIPAAAGSIPILSFGARHVPPRVASRLEQPWWADS
jgi:hypothetical protein